MCQEKAENTYLYYAMSPRTHTHIRIRTYVLAKGIALIKHSFFILYCTYITYRHTYIDTFMCKSHVATVSASSLTVKPHPQVSHGALPDVW